MGLFDFGKKKDGKKSARKKAVKKPSKKRSPSKKSSQKGSRKTKGTSNKGSKKGAKKSSKKSTKSGSKGAKKKPSKKAPASGSKKSAKKSEATKDMSREEKEALIKEKIDDGWIHARVLMEMLGAPKEHIVKTFNDYLRLIEEDEEAVLLELEKEKPEQQKELWSIFADLELLFPDASSLVFFCFDYMPSSIEIIEPEVFHYPAKGFSDFFNDLQAKLHKMDFYVKNMTAENKNLKRNANLLLRNNIMIVLKHEGPLALEDLSKKVGIPAEQLEPFLKTMVDEGHIKKEKDKYKR